MVNMMFASAVAFHPRARRVVLTDPSTSFCGISRRIDEIVRSHLDGKRLMLERARAQLRYVKESRFDGPLVILDSDVLINGSLAHLFEQDFDVAVTWRNHPAGQPINGGLLILNCRRPDVSRHFFEKYVAKYERDYADEHASWFGDQMALRDCVGLSAEELARQDVVEIDGCRILLLPCDVYNFSPENRMEEINNELSGKLVLHFKGERKRLMEPFWRAWLRPRTSRWPWVRVQALRERQKLQLDLDNSRAARASEKL